MVQCQGASLLVCYLQDPRFKVSRNTNATAPLTLNCCSGKSRQIWKKEKKKEEKKEDGKIKAYLHNSSNI